MTASSFGMALFGMVWLLRVRAEIKRCSKCQRHGERQKRTANQRPISRSTTFFTIDGAISPRRESTVMTPLAESATFCEVHGYRPMEDGELLVYFTV